MLFDTFETSSMTINGEELICTNKEVHLGNVIGTCKNATKYIINNKNKNSIINNATNDFTKRVNVINAQFRCRFSSTKYKLLKHFACLCTYGRELCDFLCVFPCGLA